MNCLGLGNRTDLWGLTRTLSALGSLLAFLLLGAGEGAAQAKGCFGTALVFAIDASGSIDDDEYVLQMAGLSQALRSPEIASAVQGAGGVAMAAVVWSDTAVATSKVGWQSVRTAQDIERFARTMENLPRVGGGGTDLGQGVWDALDLFDDPTLCATRRVVDVSGDGKETLYPRRRHGVSILVAKRRAEDSGITINGLAITDEEADIEEYYLENVAVGVGAFVILADSFDDFGTAMKTKLLREITPINQAQLREMQPANEGTYQEPDGPLPGRGRVTPPLWRVSLR